MPLFEAVEICDSLRKPVSSTEREKRIVNKSKAELFPYYGATGQIGFIDAYLTDGEYVLLGEDGAPFLDPFASKAYVIDGKTWVNNHAHILRSKTNNRFLCYYLNSVNYKGYVSGSTRLKLTQAGMKKIPVPVPPLSEQERIVGILDAASEKIDTIQRNAERNLANAKEIFQQVLNEEMTPKPGWKKARIGDVCSKIGAGATPKGGKNSYCKDGISLIRSQNVLYNKFSYKDLAHINDNQAKLLDGVTIFANDILFNITGASIARCCVVPSNVIPARVNQHVMILRLSTLLVLHRFLVYYLIASSSQRKLLTIGEEGSTRQALTKTDLAEFEFLFPNREQQEQIVNKIDLISQKCDSVINNCTRIIAQCSELKQQILAKAFNGEL